MNIQEENNLRVENRGIASVSGIGADFSKCLRPRGRGSLMTAAPCLVCWHGGECPWHRVEVCHFAHDGKPLVLNEVEDLRNVVREFAAAVMWLSGTQVPQVVEVAEIGAPLPVESQLVLVERIKDRSGAAGGLYTARRGDW